MKAKNYFENRFNNFGLESQRKYPNEELCKFFGRNRKRFLKKKFTCLDIGVGSGANLQPMIDMNLKIDAIDISSTAIKLLKKKRANNKINFKTFDMLNIDKLNKKYDLIIDVFSSYALSTHDGKIFLKKVSSCLNKNGIFFSFFPSKKSDTWIKSLKKNRIDKNTLIKIDNKKLPYYGNNYPFRFHSKKEYLNLLKKNNFKINYCETITKTYDNEKLKSTFIIIEGEIK